MSEKAEESKGIGLYINHTLLELSMKSNPSSSPLDSPIHSAISFSHFLSCSRHSSPVGHVKGQVTRAQEAEELYLAKRELATLKQQGEEAGAQPEPARTPGRQLQPHPPQVVRRATESPAGRLHWLAAPPSPWRQLRLARRDGFPLDQFMSCVQKSGRPFPDVLC